MFDRRSMIGIVVGASLSMKGFVKMAKPDIPIYEYVWNSSPGYTNDPRYSKPPFFEEGGRVYLNGVEVSSSLRITRCLTGEEGLIETFIPDGDGYLCENFEPVKEIIHGKVEFFKQLYRRVS